MAVADGWLFLIVRAKRSGLPQHSRRSNENKLAGKGDYSVAGQFANQTVPRSSDFLPL
jgi:hypothetical protein